MGANDTKEDKTGELILALQNRINDLEAKLGGLETERKSKSWVESATLDSKIAEVKAVIGELEKKQSTLLEGAKNGGNGHVETKNWVSDYFGWLD